MNGYRPSNLHRKIIINADSAALNITTDVPENIMGLDISPHL
jgi:hypothetical protein